MTMLRKTDRLARKSMHENRRLSNKDTTQRQSVDRTVFPNTVPHVESKKLSIPSGKCSQVLELLGGGGNCYKWTLR